MKNNRYIYTVATLFILIFCGLIGYMAYFTTVESKKIAMHPFNRRLDHLESEVIRGTIYDQEGTVLAKSEGGTRTYPYGELYAHAVGYVGHGKTGAEAAANIELLYPDYNVKSLFTYAFANEKFEGHDVYLTLNHKLQQACADGLKNKKGAAIILEPTTGKILAMYSNPSFDPNRIGEKWNQYTEEDSVLINRATQGLYPPGSTFKILTAISYLKKSPEKALDFEYQCTGKITKDGYDIRCYDGKVHGLVNLKSAFTKSCNAYFVALTEYLSVSELGETAQQLFFNESLPANIESSKSQFQLTEESDTFNKLASYIGQGQTLMSPLHLAMITSIIYNDGILMTPYIIDKSVDSSGKVAIKNLPSHQGTYLDEKTCRILKEMMLNVVTEGTASRINRSDLIVGGKTGTAENETGRDHSLFVGFAEDDNHNKESIVFAVIVEQGGKGAQALNVADKILDAYAD